MDKAVQAPEIKQLAAWMIWFWEHRHEVVSFAGRYGHSSVNWLPQDIHVDAVHAVPFGHYGVGVTWWPIRAILDTTRYPTRRSAWSDAKLTISGNGIDLWEGGIQGIGRWNECNENLWRDGIKTLIQIIDNHARIAQIPNSARDLDSYERMEQLQRLGEIREAEEALAVRIRRYADRLDAKEADNDAVS